ncbi:MAG: KH domain-containing protein [Anaerolineales bacterium]|nr:KH domain-containing protein [Anaerolineales bacterium]
MRDLIEYIARSLVDDPTQVRIEQTIQGSSIHFELEVAKEDMGRVIGRGGRVANAIRALLRVAAARQDKRVSLDIVDPR